MTPVERSSGFRNRKCSLQRRHLGVDWTMEKRLAWCRRVGARSRSAEALRQTHAHCIGDY